MASQQERTPASPFKPDVLRDKVTWATCNNRLRAQQGAAPIADSFCDEQVAVVTGGSSGIGLEISRQLGEQGAPHSCSSQHAESVRWVDSMRSPQACMELRCSSLGGARTHWMPQLPSCVLRASQPQGCRAMCGSRRRARGALGGQSSAVSLTWHANGSMLQANSRALLVAVMPAEPCNCWSCLSRCSGGCRRLQSSMDASTSWSTALLATSWRPPRSSPPTASAQVRRFREWLGNVFDAVCGFTCACAPRVLKNSRHNV